MNMQLQKRKHYNLYKDDQNIPHASILGGGLSQAA